MNIHSFWGCGLLFFVTCSSAFSQSSSAAESCLSGNASEQNLTQQLTRAKKKSAVTQAIYKQYNLENSNTQAVAGCTECAAKPLAERPVDVDKMATKMSGIPAAPTLLFKPECLATSASFQPGTNQVGCDENNRITKATNLCMSQTVMTYQNAVVSSFLSCATKVGLSTVTPETLFTLYSLESSFKPQFTSGGGTGFGQLTPIFVADQQQKGRGLEQIQKIASSDLKECEAAKIVARKDLNQKSSLNNKCSFMASGEGLERNILYGMIGLSTAWNRNFKKRVEPYLAKYANDPKAIKAKEIILMASYGPGGNMAAGEIFSRLSRLSPEKFIERAKRPIARSRGGGKPLNQYNVALSKRQTDIGKKLSEPLKSAFANEGARACVNP